MKRYLPFRGSSNSGQAPYLRSVWSAERIALSFLACLLVPLGVAIYDRGAPLFSVVAVAIVVAVGWQAVFSWVRKHPLGWDGIGTAIVFALIAGDAVPLWQVALAVTFGIVVGEQIFGGRGYNFLNPAVVALAFVTFSFTGSSFADPAPWLEIATLPAGVFLITTRLISWRMIVGIIAGLVATGFLRGQGLLLDDLLRGSFFFIVVFLACDPVSSASTNPGRWANGLLIGFLAWVFAPAGGPPTVAGALIPAILLASVFAPLIDTIVVTLNAYARRRRDV